MEGPRGQKRPRTDDEQFGHTGDNNTGGGSSSHSLDGMFHNEQPAIQNSGLLSSLGNPQQQPAIEEAGLLSSRDNPQLDFWSSLDFGVEWENPQALLGGLDSLGTQVLNDTTTANINPPLAQDAAVGRVGAGDNREFNLISRTGTGDNLEREFRPTTSNNHPPSGQSTAVGRVGVGGDREVNPMSGISAGENVELTGSGQSSQIRSDSNHSSVDELRRALERCQQKLRLQQTQVERMQIMIQHLRADVAIRNTHIRALTLGHAEDPGEEILRLRQLIFSLERDLRTLR